MFFAWGCSNDKPSSSANHAPILIIESSLHMVVDSTMYVKVQATDADGDSIILSAISLPANSAFVDSCNGKGTLVFTPDSAQVGSHLLTFIARDNAAADSVDADLAVSLTASDSISTPTTHWENDGYWESLVDATSSSHYSYYSFSRKDTVAISDSQAPSDTSWDIAFKRSTVILNSGVSGNGGVDGIDLAAIGNPDSVNFDALTDIGSLGNPTWIEDSYDLIVDDWYSYNPNNHTLAPTRYIYIMKDALGNYVKFQVSNMANPGMPPNMGTITLVFDYSGASPNFPNSPDTLSFDASGGGPIYIDFSSGAVVNPSDPRTSTDWDIAFTNYEVHQNSTVFGPGSAAAYAVWQDQIDPTDFNETMTAPTAPQAYFSDNLGSVMTNWYNYNGDTHTLTSKQHVYVIRDGSNYYKLQITTYYKAIGGNPVSGYYTFKWLALD